MAPAPKKTVATPVTKPAGRPVVKKKVRLSQAEATIKMLSATANLLLKNPPERVTVQKICQAADVHTDYVVRYFGSREELLCQAIEAAFVGVVLREDGNTSRIDDTLANSAGLLEKAHARFRTIAYLLGCGVEAERFQPSQQIVLAHLLAEAKNPNTSERTKKSMIMIGSLLFQSLAIFAEVNSVTDQQRADLLAFIGLLPKISDTVEKELGWDKPLPKKRK
jgi:AcrR family transcriptional regulator